MVGEGARTTTMMMMRRRMKRRLGVQWGQMV
jgi:hypothetical protein